MAKILMVQVRVRGEAPLLMHNERGVNPFDPLVKQIAALTSKRTKKTEDDKHMISRLEWEVGLYFSEELGPYIPGENFKKALMEAATAFRGGTAIKRGVTPMDAEIPLLYHGPRDIQGLWDAGYVDIRSAGVNRNKVMRARPRFDAWGLEATLQINTSVLDLDSFRRYVLHAGRITGLGDYRPRFGRFVSEIEVQEEVELDDTLGLEDETNVDSAE